MTTTLAVALAAVVAGLGGLLVPRLVRALPEPPPPDEPYPGDAAEGQRGRAGSPKRTVLPDGWLDSRTLGTAERGTLTETEADTSGG